jgi:hypothetical protein
MATVKDLPAHARLGGATSTRLAPQQSPFALKLLASRASRVGGLRARAGTYVQGQFQTSYAFCSARAPPGKVNRWTACSRLANLYVSVTHLIAAASLLAGSLFVLGGRKRERSGPEGM